MVVVVVVVVVVMVMVVMMVMMVMVIIVTITVLVLMLAVFAITWTDSVAARAGTPNAMVRAECQLLDGPADMVDR